MESLDIKELVRDLKQEYLSIWWETKSDFPIFQQRISLRDKLDNEKKIEVFRKELFKVLKEMPKEEGQLNAWSNRITTLINELELNVAGYENKTIEFFTSKGYSNITDLFIREVRSFDPELDVHDVFQAIRNVWIMNSLQILFDIEVDLTPSVFAYSMLYPYSDNYLDDPDVHINDKHSFNKKFKGWLSGENERAISKNQERIYQLVKKIEGQFPRLDYQQVFDSLVSIHSAQEKSLSQQRAETTPYERDILGTTFEKGGTSVLADGYLVKGQLSKKEAKFLFGYGVFLQIIDDLQDMKADYENQHSTIFSQLVNKFTLDKLTNKLFWFIEEILMDSDIFSTGDAERLKGVIHDSCLIMIFEAISKNRKMFSKKYIKEIEEYSMLRFSYYKKLKKKLQQNFSSEDILNICLALSRNIEEKQKAF
ncbi:hypothetical protein [Alkaliphilus peptidifermentans]|uniref:Uncharacterized protein n=1 Tax=Alkaliphilus peptidifermentans DSM 18978 TaxID=1120976 RepID=A0A1G5FTL3_9FIRM|nr:hypothetical protein [Alkaliphilus peptidifermentans]SCY42593.1 hypothetical protein SAMN03080606_01484 [Alkaliphilus peptidifermentans DSM 18978]